MNSSRWGCRKIRFIDSFPLAFWKELDPLWCCRRFPFACIFFFQVVVVLAVVFIVGANIITFIAVAICALYVFVTDKTARDTKGTNSRRKNVT